MNKEIYFCIDDESHFNVWTELNEPNIKKRPICLPKSYYETERMLKIGCDVIITTSLAHMSFGLQNDGYNIYLCYGDKKIQIDKEDIMQALENDGMYDAMKKNLLEMFLGGRFDELLNLQK